MDMKEILEGLADAGCTVEEIEQFQSCMEGNDINRGMKLLEKCRKECLMTLHDSQRKIDTLDYVAYQINKQ